LNDAVQVMSMKQWQSENIEMVTIE